MSIYEILPALDLTQSVLVRDSSAVRRLFVRLAGAMGRQSAFHKENSGFAILTLGRHISTFRAGITLSVVNVAICGFFS